MYWTLGSVTEETQEQGSPGIAVNWLTFSEWDFLDDLQGMILLFSVDDDCKLINDYAGQIYYGVGTRKGNIGKGF